MNRSESIVKPFEWHAGRAMLPPHIEDLFLMTTPSAEELLHELLAHQSQLEMQHDELRSSEQRYRKLAASLELHCNQLEETVAARTAELLATQREAERLARLAIEVETAARAAKFNISELADDVAKGMNKLLDAAKKHLRSPTETH